MSKFIFGLNFALTVAIAEGNPAQPQGDADWRQLVDFSLGKQCGERSPEIYGYQITGNQPDAGGLPKEEK